MHQCCKAAEASRNADVWAFRHLLDFSAVHADSVRTNPWTVQHMPLKQATGHPLAYGTHCEEFKHPLATNAPPLGHV
uniref:Uncharacterized protein n=1 Tax=Ascaris lumbricoides TaxID=6252 RepID=A0A0M3HW40_ASCLU